MDSVLNSMVVTAIFFAIAVVVGRRLERSPKPYGLAILSVHISLFLLIAGGVIASIYKINGVIEGKMLSTISLYIVAMTLLGNLTIGTIMAISKQKNMKPLYKAIPYKPPALRSFRAVLTFRRPTHQSPYLREKPRRYGDFKRWPV
jgi:hypothetical protein